MLYRHYEINKRRVVFAAMMGENKEGKREVFYSAIDYTDEPNFDDAVTHDKAREWLEGELRDYGFVPLSEVPKLPDLESKLKKAMGINNSKRLELMDKASKLVTQLGDTPNELFDRGYHAGKRLLFPS